MRYFVVLCTLIGVGITSGQQINLRGTLTLSSRTAVDAVGSTAYAVGNNNLSVVSLSNPDSPSLLGQVTPNVPQLTGIEVWGNYAYCAGQAQGLVVIRVQNPSQPQWVINQALAFPARDVAVYDTLVAVATAGNVTLLGVRNPADPNILATYTHAASWIEFNGPAHILHVGSTSNAFALQINANIGGDTTFSLTLFDQYGSESLTPVAFASPYVNAVHDAAVRVIRADNYTLAGQYTSTAPISAITSGPSFSFIGLSTGAVQFLSQQNVNPTFLDGVGVPSPVTGLALTQSGNQPYVVVAHTSGVSIIEYDALAADPGELPAIPSELSLSAYPNPFNGTTELTLSAPVSGRYELTVFDALGRKVTSRNVFLSGKGRESIDLSNHAAGNYLARLSGSSGQTTLRLLYLP